MSDTNNVSLSANATRTLMRELRALAQSSPFNDIYVYTDIDDFSTIECLINGPISTPFDHGQFKIKMHITSDYPATPPKCYFITKIFHPNVNYNTGEICVNTLKKDWQPTYGIVHILQVIRCLLIQPNPESALNEEAGKLLLENYDDYYKRAAMMCKIHAKINIDITALLKQNGSDSSTQSNGNTQQSSDKENTSNTQAVDTTVKPVEKSKPVAQAKKNLKRL